MAKMTMEEWEVERKRRVQAFADAPVFTTFEDSGESYDVKRLSPEDTMGYDDEEYQMHYDDLLFVANSLQGLKAMVSKNNKYNQKNK